jgi:hypothetical protein
LAADFTYRLNDEAKGIALAYADIIELLRQNGKSRERDFPQLPVPSIVHGKDAFLPEQELVLFVRMERTLYEDQLVVVQFVKHYLDGGTLRCTLCSGGHWCLGCLGNNCVMVGGLGGSGKTYLYTALYHLIRSHPNGGPVVNMAATGIAATLLPDGRTVHSAFALPIPVFSDSKSKYDGRVAPAYIREAKAFVLDEVSMCSKHVLECVSRTLSKMHQNGRPFGGVLMIIGGDFRVRIFGSVSGIRFYLFSNACRSSSARFPQSSSNCR